MEDLLALAVKEAADLGAGVVEPVHLFLAALERAPSNRPAEARALAVRTREAARASGRAHGAQQVSARMLAVLEEAQKRAAKDQRALEPLDILIAATESP